MLLFLFMQSCSTTEPYMVYLVLAMAADGS